MTLLKQALIHLKLNGSFAFFLGIAATALTLSLRFMPYLSSLLISLSLLYLQEFSNTYLRTSPHTTKWLLAKSQWLPLLIAALILVPSTALLGSGIGLLQRPENFLFSSIMAWGLFFIEVTFYLILCHSLQLRENLSLSFIKAIDMAALGFIRKPLLYFHLSFYLSLLILASVLSYGAGLLVTLPLLFFSTYFSYEKLSSEDAWKSPPKKMSGF